MHIGIPREIKPQEGRVSLTPDACSVLLKGGHQVYLQSSAGVQSGYSDQAYRDVGVEVLEDAATLYEKSRLIVKVKEPVDADLQYLDGDHILFCYLHLAAAPGLLEKLLAIGLTAIGFETVQTSAGNLPLLTPMSVIAGRLAGQIGTNLLHANEGGKGLLLGGMATTERGDVVVLGAGNAGSQAIDLVASIGANVTVFDLNEVKLAHLYHKYPNLTALKPTHSQIARAVANADLLIGAVLVPGAKAPVLVEENMVQNMEAGSVVIDIAVDQGGCIETIHPTTYGSPVYTKHDVLHFGVTNMPGSVPKTASQALSAAIIQYVEKIAAGRYLTDTELLSGLNVDKGAIRHPALK